MGPSYFHLCQNLQLELERIQLKAIKLALGLCKSTPSNEVLAESDIPPLTAKFKCLGRNYLSKAISRNHHPVISVTKSYLDLLEDPTYIKRRSVPCLIQEFYNLERISHVFQQSEAPMHYCVQYEALLFKLLINFDQRKVINQAKVVVLKFQKVFISLLSRSQCFFTDGSKMDNKEFVGFAVVWENINAVYSYRTVDLAPIFTAEAMAIEETLNMIA